MVTIIHGNDPVTSRKFFLDQKDKDSVTFDAEALELSELELSLQGSGLFGSTKKVFIENLFTRKGSKNVEDVAKYLDETPDNQVYIWADKELPAKSISPFKKPEIQNFKIPSSIFSFLDGLRPDSQQNLVAFHNALSSTEPEIIFFMMIRQFRLLLGLTSGSNSNIDEVKRLAPWQRGKLLRQASLFGTSKLKEIYGLIYKIDKNQKTDYQIR